MGEGTPALSGKRCRARVAGGVRARQTAQRRCSSAKRRGNWVVHSVHGGTPRFAEGGLSPGWLDLLKPRGTWSPDITTANFSEFCRDSRVREPSRGYLENSLPLLTVQGTNKTNLLQCEPSQSTVENLWPGGLGILALSSSNFHLEQHHTRWKHATARQAALKATCSFPKQIPNTAGTPLEQRKQPGTGGDILQKFQNAQSTWGVWAGRKSISPFRST